MLLLAKLSTVSTGARMVPGVGVTPTGNRRPVPHRARPAPAETNEAEAARLRKVGATARRQLMAQSLFLLVRPPASKVEVGWWALDRKWSRAYSIHSMCFRSFRTLPSAAHVVVYSLSSLARFFLQIERNLSLLTIVLLFSVF